jgi:hypothetical protein
MAITHQLQHVQQGLSRLISSYKDKPLLGALLTSYLKEVQQIENALIQLLNERLPDTATSTAVLDILGRIVGQPRSGRDNDTYRLWIKARIAVNRGSGTIPELNNILQLVLPSDQAFELYEDSYPAHFEVLVPDPVEFLPAQATSGMLAPFDFSGGGTLDLEVDDNGLLQTPVFTAGPLTAQETADEFNAQVVGATAHTFGDRLVIESDTPGSLSVLEFTASTPLTVLGITPGVYTGPEANQEFMQTVADILLTAKAGGVRGIMRWSTSPESFGFDADPHALGFTEGEFASAAGR